MRDAGGTERDLGEEPGSLGCCEGVGLRVSVTVTAPGPRAPAPQIPALGTCLQRESRDQAGRRCWLNKASISESGKLSD